MDLQTREGALKLFEWIADALLAVLIACVGVFMSIEEDESSDTRRP
jgi:hypothetical protein